jgi:2,5-diketo-D-gluconate reductase B
MDYLLTAYTPLSRGGVGRDETLRAMGEAHDKTATQAALRWLLQQDKVCAIPKATGEEHLRENLDVFDFELSDEEMDRVFSLGR